MLPPTANLRLPKLPGAASHTGLGDSAANHSEDDPAAATDFLVNQCGTLEVQLRGGSWGTMQVASDIAAGLSSVDQCRGVMSLLKSWPRPQDQEIQRLEKAALYRWSRWDPAGAKAAASP